MYFSIIIPLFNRPNEIDELLLSLCNQTNKQFEVIIAEDGSSIKSDKVVEKYKDKLSIIYFEKLNSGPGLTRNKAVEKANFEWLIFFDSDCIIPENYIESVTIALNSNTVDAYGGPDAALSSFTPVQKAINYSMTSFFTTGGIRGGSKTMDKFHPRSFNMGVTRKAFDTLNGYGKMRFGEDIDFSLRLLESGFQTALIPDACVYHKRRTNFRQFFKQVFNSGIARINLQLLHPGSLKLVHSLPACFVIGVAVILILSLFYPTLLLLPLTYSILIFIDSLLKNRSMKVALYSIASSWVQLMGYGSGFISAFWNRLILKKGAYNAFEKKFYD